MTVKTTPWFDYAKPLRGEKFIPALTALKGVIESGDPGKYMYPLALVEDHVDRAVELGLINDDVNCSPTPFGEHVYKNAKLAFINRSRAVVEAGSVFAFEWNWKIVLEVAAPLLEAR